MQGVEMEDREDSTLFLCKTKDLMLVDVTRPYYRQFIAPKKLIESALPPCTESSFLLAGPPPLHFLRNTTFQI